MFFKVNNAGAKEDSIAMFCLSLLITLNKFQILIYEISVLKIFGKGIPPFLKCTFKKRNYSSFVSKLQKSNNY